MKKEMLRRLWNFYRKWLISIFLRYGNLEIHACSYCISIPTGQGTKCLTITLIYYTLICEKYVNYVFT